MYSSYSGNDRTRIMQERDALIAVSDAPRYTSTVTLTGGMRARESFATVGRHGIDGVTRRLMLYLN